MSLSRPVLVDLAAYLDPQRVALLAAGTSKGEALHTLADMAASSPAISDPEAFRRAIFEREEVSSTGVGGGIAVPHAKLPSNHGFAIAIGIAPEGIEFQAKDGEPVRILVMIAAPESERDTYLRVLATVAARLKQPAVVEALQSAGDGPSAIAALLE